MSESLRPWEDDRLAANGQSVRENFTAWFEGSKAVTDEGNPMVVSHGTHKEFDVFKPSSRGTYGPGIYFADTDSSAHEYGATRVVQAFLNLQNPWIVSADHESEAAQAEEFECPLVDDVLLLPAGRRLLDVAKITESGHFGQGLQDHLVELGYDGVIATYPDGSQEVVAFRPDQVKCAQANSGLYDRRSLDIRDGRGLESGRPVGRLGDARAIARYMQSFAGNESFDEDMAEEHFFECAATLTRFAISDLLPGPLESNVRSADKDRLYSAMDAETSPPIVVEDGQVMDGNHRRRAAIARGDSYILGYLVHPDDEMAEPYRGPLDPKGYVTSKSSDAVLLGTAEQAQAYLAQISSLKKVPHA